MLFNLGISYNFNELCKFLSRKIFVRAAVDTKEKEGRTLLENNDYFVKNTLRKYFVPTVISILGSTAITFINTLITGNLYGKAALAAVNLINPVTFLFAMFGCLICIGGSTCTSVAMGREDDEAVGAYVTLSLIAVVVIPLLFSVTGMLFFRPLLSLLGVTDELYAAAADYGRVMLATGMFTSFMYYPFNFLRVDGRGQYSMLIFGAMGVLDVLFVVGFHRAGFGLAGVGAAVALSTALASAGGLVVLFFGKGHQLRLGRVRHPWSELLQIFYAGGAAALNNLCNMLRTIFLNGLVLAALGQDGVSMFAAACAALNFASAFVAGAGQAISPLAGVFFGERDDVSLRMLMKSAVRYSLFLMSGVFVLSLAGSVPLAYAFGMRGAYMVKGTAAAICWVMLSLIPATIANCYIFYYMTIRRSAFASLLTFCRSFGFVALFAKLFAMAGARQILLAAFALGELATLALNVLLAAGICKRHPQLEGMLLLERREKDCYISFSVPGSVDGAMTASARMAEFCAQQGLDDQVSMMLPLAIEEMLVLVNEHCFEGNEKMFSDVRIFLSNEEVLLRIRCGGKLFDPIADYRRRTVRMSGEELLMDESLGIRMITEAAKSVTFRRTLGVNNLVVIL